MKELKAVERNRDGYTGEDLYDDMLVLQVGLGICAAVQEKEGVWLVMSGAIQGLLLGIILCYSYC